MSNISKIKVSGTSTVLTADTGTINYTKEQTTIVAIKGTEVGTLRNDIPYTIEYVEDTKQKLHQGMMFRGKTEQNYTFKNP